MIVGVDAGALAITDERLKVGVWRVTFNILRELLKLDQKNEYRLYSFGRAVGEIREIRKIGGKRVSEVQLPAAGWSSLWLPIHLRLFPVDVFLGLAQALPASPSRSIGFIYDLGFLYHPEVYGASAKKLAKQTADLVKRADDIITISKSSKQDILKAYRIDGERVHVAYPGVTFTNFSRPRKIGEWRRRPYFLFVGSLNKAKDLPLAIEAFVLFLKKTKKPYDFLLVGGDYWPDATINQSIDLYQLHGRVHRLGFVPDAQLPAYYRGATAFVTSALHEGFCLPAVEAMAAGTPVVAVDRGAMKEIVRDGGIIVSHISATALADAFFTIATDAKMRKNFGRKAIELSKKYNWRRFAEAVMSLY